MMTSFLSAMLFTGFLGSDAFGELTFLDSASLRDWRKVTHRSSLQLSDGQYQFTLPFHKADCLFAGNQIMVRDNISNLGLVTQLHHYLASRDTLFPLHSPLWLCSTGDVPTRSFFMRRLRFFLSADFGGQSMCAGGATWLAERGVSPSLIQAMGCWSSAAFLIYIRRSPAQTVPRSLCSV
jgi:hypothetical protein